MSRYVPVADVRPGDVLILRSVPNLYQPDHVVVDRHVVSVVEFYAGRYRVGFKGGSATYRPEQSVEIE